MPKVAGGRRDHRDGLAGHVEKFNAVAVRQALDYTGTGRAILVTVLGFVAFVVMLMLLAMFFGVGIGLVEAVYRGAR